MKVVITVVTPVGTFESEVIEADNDQQRDLRSIGANKNDSLVFEDRDWNTIRILPGVLQNSVIKIREVAE